MKRRLAPHSAGSGATVDEEPELKMPDSADLPCDPLCVAHSVFG